MPRQDRPEPAELELAWVLQGGIFYYGVRKYIYNWPVLEQKSRVISNALDVFLEGIARVFGTTVRVRQMSPRAPGASEERLLAPADDLPSRAGRG